MDAGPLPAPPEPAQVRAVEHFLQKAVHVCWIMGKSELAQRRLHLVDALAEIQGKPQAYEPSERPLHLEVQSLLESLASQADLFLFTGNLDRARLMTQHHDVVQNLFAHYQHDQEQK